MGASWRVSDRIGFVASWAAGLLLCAIAGSILVYMLIKGLQYVTPNLLFSHPQSDVNQVKTGGFLDPLEGTLLIVAVGTAIAAPLGVLTALWLNEFGRPRWLARLVEGGIEVVAGTPSVVLAIFGLIFFSGQIFAFLSTTGQGGGVTGRSLILASSILAIEALPLVVTATRESLRSVPAHVREASYALGKTRIATIRRVLLPAARPGIATGTVLGMGRMMGDTAVILILAGGTLQLQGAGGLPGLSTLRGTGSTLTSYVYNNSPAGEGNAPGKAYAAAFVLLALVLILNFFVERVVRRGQEAQWIR